LSKLFNSGTGARLDRGRAFAFGRQRFSEKNGKIEKMSRNILTMSQALFLVQYKKYARGLSPVIFLLNNF
jgi:hypothetical protein